LKSLEKFDEVLVLDNGSIDGTVDIASGFQNVSILKHEFIGFGPLKNLAVDRAKHDWILSIDSDEIISPELVEEISRKKLHNRTVYSIVRENYYNHKKVKCCGWENDKVNRLFNKKLVRFNNNLVHESLEFNNDIQLEIFKYKLKHYTYNDVSELIQKMEHYSTLWAEGNKYNKKSSPLKAVIKSFAAFIKFFILKKGFLGGYIGLIISVSNANGVFYKYMKLYEIQKKL
jgi:glycosyltransferase involved in cell wall biosynthesis